VEDLARYGEVKAFVHDFDGTREDISLYIPVNTTHCTDEELGLTGDKQAKFFPSND